MKYEFTGETKVWCGITLRRIRATESRGIVVTGELGGWIGAECNLSADGNAWVCGDAWVYGNARVSGSARVSGDAWVSGDARVYGDALITVGPIGSRRATLTALLDAKIGVRITTGCFSGSLNEFRAAVESTHGQNEHGVHYRAAIALIEARFSDALKNQEAA